MFKCDNVFSTLYCIRHVIPEFIPKDIVVVGGICSVYLTHTSYINFLCTRSCSINDGHSRFTDLNIFVITCSKVFMWVAISFFLVR